jgi:hypothetical protein
MKNVRTKTTANLIAVLLLALVIPAAADAQDDTIDPERVRTAIERTDRVLEEAGRIVSETESGKARLVLQNAREIQSRAHETFRQAEANMNRFGMGFALKLTIEAREQALRAATLAKEDRDRENRARQAIERARDLLGRARERAVSNPVGPARERRVRRLLEEAREQLENAHTQMRQLQYRVAVGLAVSSQRLCEQALNLLQSQDLTPDETRSQIERTDRLLEEAARMAGRAEAGPRMLLERAGRLQDRAREQLGAGQFHAALRLTLEARQLVHRVLRLEAGRGSPERARRALEMTDGLLERTRPTIEQAAAAGALELFERGVALQREAHRSFGRDDFEGALQRTLEARSLVQRSLDAVGPATGRAEAERAVEGAGRLLEDSSGRILGSGSDEGKRLLERAMSHLEAARERLGEEAWDEALGRATMARRLVLRALNLIQNDEQGP